MLLIRLGISLFIIHGVMYLLIQARLWNKGLVKSRWTTIASSVRMYRTYIQVAGQNHWSPALGYLAPTFLVGSLILIFWGVMTARATR